MTKKTNHKKDLNVYIKKSHISLLEKFKSELEQYKNTCDPEGRLYEDAFTSFTLDNIILVDGSLHYDYDGKPDCDMIVMQDEETGEYYEDEVIDGLVDTVRFWRACLRRARRYWSMNVDELDAIQSGEREDDDDEEA